jgi:hypothetical protein
MNLLERRHLYANLAKEYFANKPPVIEHESRDCNSITFRTYEIAVALFKADFHKAPKVKSLRVRLSDNDYLRLLQWQMHNPNCSFNHYEIDPDIRVAIESSVEEQFFPDGNIGTYAIYLTEIKRDADSILQTINDYK